MLQIRGIVKTAHKAQDSLKVGISSREVPAFKKFITTSVETIEHLCTQSNIKPAQLPSRSRQAYFFLKSIDLDNLPLVENPTQPQTSQTISIESSCYVGVGLRERKGVKFECDRTASHKVSVQ